MSNYLSKLYRVLDKEVKQSLDKNGIVPACQRGCSHCCYILTIVHMVEAHRIAAAVLRKQTWKEVAERCRTSALASHADVDPLAYHQAQIPCPLLNLEKGDCSVYELRPASCRFYLVTTKNSCALRNNEAYVAVVDTAMAQAEAMKACVAVAGGELTVAPLSLAVLFSMLDVARRTENEAYLRGLTEGLPGPEAWQEQADQLRTYWKSLETRDVQESLNEAFVKVFLSENRPT